MDRRLCAFLVLGTIVAPGREAPSAPAPVLREAAQVRALSAEEVARRPAVRLTGVVTFVEAETGIAFVQDPTAGVALAAGLPGRLPPEFRAGMRVEVRGVVAPGRYAPVVAGAGGEVPEVRVEGPGELPVPLSGSLENLLGGQHDGRWVEMRGTVRSASVRAFSPESEGEEEVGAAGEGAAAAPRLVLELGTAAGRFTVILPWSQERAAPAGLVDARVRVRGVLGSIVNRWRQWVGLLLYVPSRAEIQVERPPAGDPFSLPLRRADEIMGFAPGAPEEDRVRVRGVVTLVQPGFRIYLRSEGGPLEVQTSQDTRAIEPGVEVEVVGYPILGGKRALLQDARVRVQGRAAHPRPLPTTLRSALGQHRDGELVEVHGRLFQNALRGLNRVLVLEADGQLFEARFGSSLSPAEDLPVGELRPGAVLAVTGIAQVQGRADWGGGVRPTAFNLLLRRPGDLVVVHEPPWWTPARLAAMVGALLAVVVLGAGWVVLLRRRVLAQTAVIREQARREANERERRRIAQDIHDDLGSRLTQLALLGARVKAAAAGDAPTGELGERISETARTTVQTMDEIVWAVNPGNDTLQSLGDYLCKVATSLLGGAGIACQLEVPAVLPVRPVSAELRHNLVLAVREALHNVVKHAQATEASLALRLEGEDLVIEVTDNGVGLPAAGVRRGNGLGNLQRRLAELRGTCEIGPGAGGGTRVRLTAQVGAR